MHSSADEGPKNLQFQWKLKHNVAQLKAVQNAVASSMLLCSMLERPTSGSSGKTKRIDGKLGAGE